MRVLCTGLSGLDKKPLLERVAAGLRRAGMGIELFHLGDMMYTEDESIKPGRILDLPYGQLRQLRRTVFRDVLRCPAVHIVVNTHATFRWRTGLFAGFDVDQISAFGADLYVCLVEDVDQTYLRLKSTRVPEAFGYALKDLFVWREEELLATELMAGIPARKGHFLIAAVPDAENILQTLFLRPELKRAYISYPITSILDNPAVRGEIEHFKREMKSTFLAFDPFDVKESWMISELEKIRAGKLKRDYIEVDFEGAPRRIPADEVAPCVRDIDGQIVARDLKLIEQADLVVAYMPDIGDQPVHSPGVVREITHASNATKDVYIIWTSSKDPSPFIKDIVPHPAAIFPDLTSALPELRALAGEPRSQN